MTLRLSKYVLYAKLEPIASYGTAVTPTIADTVNARNVVLTPEYNPQNIPRGDRGFWYKTLPGAQLRTLSFDVPLTCAKTNGVAGEITRLLIACGWFEASGETNRFDKICEYNATNSSLNFLFYNDGIRHTMYGARGSASFTISAGMEPIVHFVFTGLYVSGDAVEQPAITPDKYMSGTIFVVKGSSIEIGGVYYHFSNLEFTDGNVIVPIRDASATEGIGEIGISDTNPRGTINPLVESSNAATLETLVENGSDVVLTYEAFPTAGGDDKNPVLGMTIKFESYTREDESGFLRYTMPFIITALSLDLEKAA